MDPAISTSIQSKMNQDLGRRRRISKKGIIYFILIVYALVDAYPILWMILNSFKSEKEFSINPFGIPHHFVLANYANAWESANLGVLFFNSIFVSVIAVAVTILIGSLASYFLSRFHFKMNKYVHAFFLFGMLIPLHSTLVPMFLLVKNLGLLNNRFTLILPYVAFNLPITIFILVSFMKAFPKEIEESAIMDGCGIFRIFWSIIWPMTRPALASVIILNFINNWNEFSFALVLVNNSDLKTLPLGLASFAGQYTTNYGAQMAGLTMVLLPTLLFYLLLEKDIVKGMTSGAVKG
jgi:raffinose/stachyose/melibiose transport system permease protein